MGMKINQRVIVVRESIKKLVPMLAEREIRVTQQGAEAYVQWDPKTLDVLRVNIPYLPDDATDELLDAVQGFLDHEVGHVLETDSAVVLQAAKEKLHFLHNVIEDTFVERRMRERFPGAATNLNRVLAFMLNERIEKKRLANPHVPPINFLLVPAVRAWAGQSAAIDYMRDKWGLIEEHAKLAGPDIANKVQGVQSTLEGLELARELRDRWKKHEPEPQPEQSMGTGRFGEESQSEPGEEPKGAPGTGEDTSEADKPKDDPKKTEPKKNEGKAKDPEDDAGEKAKGKDKTDDKDKEKGGDDQDGEESEGAGEVAEGEPGDGPSDGAGDEGSEEDEDGSADGAGGQGAGAADGEPGDDDTGDSSGAGSEGEDDAGDGADSGGDSPGNETAGDEGSAASDSFDGSGPADADDGPGSGAETSDGPESDGSDRDGSGSDEGDASEGDKRGGSGSQHDEPTAYDDINPDLIPDFDREAAEALSEQVREEQEDTEYLIYTQDEDVLEVLPVKNATDAKLKELMDSVDHLVGPLSKDMERAIVAQSAAVWTAGHRSGRLHGGSLHRLRFNDPRVYRRKQENETKDVAVSLVIDSSGSMCSRNKIGLACQAAYGLSSTLDRLQINHEVIGFTTESFSRETANRCRLESDKHGIQYSRWEALYMPLIKGFNERVTVEVRRRLVELSMGEICNNNVDGECVQIAAHRLAQQPQKRRIMMVLSDGQPSAMGYSDATLRAHLKAVVKSLMKLPDFDVVGIGIMDGAVKDYYPKHVVLHTIDDLAGTVMREIKRLLLKQINQ